MLESILNKVAGLQVCNFTKKRLQNSWFAVNIAKFLRTPVLKKFYERLLHYVPSTISSYYGHRYLIVRLTSSARMCF